MPHVGHVDREFHRREFAARDAALIAVTLPGGLHFAALVLDEFGAALAVFE
jgi:hypothetical protein